MPQPALWYRETEPLRCSEPGNAREVRRLHRQFINQRDMGYVELDIQVLGLTFSECGFLVVRDGGAAESDLSPPGIIGMNIAQKCRQLALTEFETTLGGQLTLCGGKPSIGYRGLNWSKRR